MRQLLIPFHEREIAEDVLIGWIEHEERMFEKLSKRRYPVPQPLPTYALLYEGSEPAPAAPATPVSSPTSVRGEDEEHIENLAPITWTDEEIVALHIGILDEHLERLQVSDRVESTRKMQEKLDIYLWIFAPNYVGAKRLPTGEIKRFYRDQIPFSFELCCRFARLNPERLREQLRDRLDDIGLTPILNLAREGAIKIQGATQWH